MFASQPSKLAKKEKPATPPFEKGAMLISLHPLFLDALFFLSLLVITYLTYRPALDGQPLWDDDEHLTAPDLRSIEGLARIWTQPGATMQYYPITHSVFWLEHRLWGDAMTGYHLLTLFLHVFSALLLVQIMRRLGIPLAWLIGLVFALHPVQVESVAWITELKNTLSGVFYLSGALLYLMFDKKRNRKWYTFALLFFICGLLSKSVIATLPVALLAVTWWKQGTLSWKRDIVPLAPFFAIGMASGLFTAWVEHAYIGAQGSDFNFTFIERCLIAGRTFWFYLGKALLPVNLMFIYPRWNVSQSVWWQYLFPAAELGLIALFWLVRKHWRSPLATMLFYTATLFPVMGFFNVYPFRFSFVADHFQYLALIGPITFCVAGVSRLLDVMNGTLRRFAKPALYALMVPALALLTWKQSRMYTDEETLYRSTITKNSTCCMAYNNLGIIESATARQKDAVDHYRKALQLNPAFYEAYNNLGILLWGAGRVDEAIAFYRKALSINPNYAEGNYNLGSALVWSGHTDEAISHFQKALAVKPNYVEAHNNLGNALLQAGRVDEAIEHYRKVLILNPAMEQTQNNLGVALEKTGRINEAIAQYQKALEINPALPGTHKSLAELLEKTGRTDEALLHYHQARKIAPDDIPILYSLVAALKQQGKFTEAIPLLRHAFDLAKAAGQKEAAAEIEKELRGCEKAAP